MGKVSINKVRHTDNKRDLSTTRTNFLKEIVQELIKEITCI